MFQPASLWLPVNNWAPSLGKADYTSVCVFYVIGLENVYSHWFDMWPKPFVTCHISLVLFPFALEESAYPPFIMILLFNVILSFLKPIFRPLNQAVIRHHFFIPFQFYIIISHLKQQLFYHEETAANTAIPLTYH